MHAKCFASDEVKYFIFDVNKFSGGGNYSRKLLDTFLHPIFSFTKLATKKLQVIFKLCCAL